MAGRAGPVCFPRVYARNPNPDLARLAIPLPAHECVTVDDPRDSTRERRSHALFRHVEPAFIPMLTRVDRPRSRCWRAISLGSSVERGNLAGFLAGRSTDG